MYGKKKYMGYETYGGKSKKEYLKEKIKALGKGAAKVGKYIIPEKTPEQKAFEKELSVETTKARREAYLKAAIKESKKAGERLAKGKYNPEYKKEQMDKNKKVLDNLMRL